MRARPVPQLAKKCTRQQTKEKAPPGMYKVCQDCIELGSTLRLLDRRHMLKRIRQCATIKARPENQFYVMSMSTISMCQNCSISVLVDLGAPKKV